MSPDLEKIRRAVLVAHWSARGIMRTAWEIAREPVLFAVNVVLALFVLFEEWGWRPLVAGLEKLARFKPVATLEGWIAGLPPYGALLVFALPTTVLLPLKFVALWLLANGMYWTATGLFIGAKIVSTALIARVFILTKPALMRIAWFARVYAWFSHWKDALFAEIRSSWAWRYGRMIKTSVRLATGRTWQRWRPMVEPKLLEARTALRKLFEMS